MPSARVVTERPTETRDSPTFGARFVKKRLAEIKIARAFDVNSLGGAGQFVFARNVLARDVPAFGARRFISRPGAEVVLIKCRRQQNARAG